jgi:hypothetical protein
MRKEINSQRGIGLRNSSGKERVSERVGKAEIAKPGN